MVKPYDYYKHSSLTPRQRSYLPRCQASNGTKARKVGAGGALFKIGCRRHGRCYQDQAMLHLQSLYWRGDVTNGDRTLLADILRIPKERVDMDYPSKTSTIILVDIKEKLIKF